MTAKIPGRLRRAMGGIVGMAARAWLSWTDQVQRWLGMYFALIFRSSFRRLRNSLRFGGLGMPEMVKRGRRPRGIAPMTVAERQRLERERNRRAREAVMAMECLALSPVHADRQESLSFTEILNAIFLLSKWAKEGQAVVDAWRATLSPDRRAYVAKIFDGMNIQLPFCSVCGGEMSQDGTGIWQRCECRRS